MGPESWIIGQGPGPMGQWGGALREQELICAFVLIDRHVYMIEVPGLPPRTSPIGEGSAFALPIPLLPSARYWNTHLFIESYLADHRHTWKDRKIEKQKGADEGRERQRQREREEDRARWKERSSWEGGRV